LVEAETLCSDTRRYSFRSAFETIDLGLRLTDVQELDLESEPVPFGRADPDKIRDRLERNGATDNEIAFLMEGQRVELNALTSDEFVAFVERKLTEAGIAKVVPSKDQLETAYRLFARSERIRTIVEEAIAADAGAEIAVPDDLEAQVQTFSPKIPRSPGRTGCGMRRKMGQSCRRRLRRPQFPDRDALRDGEILARGGWGRLEIAPRISPRMCPTNRHLFGFASLQ
jgi:hypothetical protein